MSRIQSTLFAAASLIAGGLLLTACPQGDVGAPCNHGTVTPPASKLVTFPALSCSDLLCVYGEEKTIPEIGCNPAGPDGGDSECNNAAGENIFECVETNSGGQCRLSLDYVLERSMCSKTCSSDSDCNNSSLSDRPAVDDDETACETGFSCTVLQRLGQFCCQKLCVCNDDLDTLENLEEKCEPGQINPQTGERVGGGEYWQECE